MRLTNSIISLHDVRLYAYHGVLPQERQVGGWYRVDVSVTYPVGHALLSDHVVDTLNYATLLALVQQEMAVPSQLMEHVGGRIAGRVFSHFPQATGLTVRLTKENPPMGADCSGASVELHFTNEKTC